MEWSGCCMRAKGRKLGVKDGFLNTSVKLVPATPTTVSLVLKSADKASGQKYRQ